MDLDARPYRAFVSVARLQSFRRAADSLNITQPALSAQIRELERRLGFQLFIRTSRSVSLTPEGGLFLPKAERFVRENDWINQAARDIRNTKLRIGAAHFTSAIAERREVLEQFMLKQPDLPIAITGRSHAQLISDLAGNEIDLAITLEAQGVATSLVEPSVPAEFDRFVIAKRKVRVLMPETSLADGPDVLAKETVDGIRIATVNRAHGVNLSEAVLRELQRLNFQPVQPPEADALSVMRYGALMGMPAIDLGWFGEVPGMSAHDVETLELRTSLVVLTRKNELRDGVELFIRELLHNSSRDK